MIPATENFEGARAMKSEVERVWVHVYYNGHRVLAKMPNGSEKILSGNANTLFEYSKHLGEPKAWTLAFEETNSFLGEIAAIKENIEWLLAIGGDDTDPGERLLAICRDELKALTQGMKAEAI